MKLFARGKAFVVALVALLSLPVAAVTIEDCASKRCPQAVFDSRFPQIEGTLTILHKDKDVGSEWLYHVHEDTGAVTTLNVPALPTTLKGGMRVRVQGTRAAALTTQGGASSGMVPERIIIVSQPQRVGPTPDKPLPPGGVPPLPPPGTAQPQTTSINPTLVIIACFTGSSCAEMNKSTIAATMVDVAGFFTANSYGAQTTAATVTDPVTLNQTANCNFSQIGTAAETAALAANPAWNAANYTFVVYVFPGQQSCGWKGLAYVGFPRKAWINGAGNFGAFIVGHEMGHNFGLFHAGSVDAVGNVREYGDQWSTMGTTNGSHFNAYQKRALGWIPATSIKRHTTGAMTYTLTDLEQPGGAVYAVEIPTALQQRTYIVESRQSNPNRLQVRFTGDQGFEHTSGVDDTQVVLAATGGVSFTDVAMDVTICVAGSCGTAPPPPPPPPPPPGTSPDGTIVPPASAINDGTSVWTLGTSAGTGNQILRNGVWNGSARGVLLKWIGGKLYTRNNNNQSYVLIGQTWTPVASIP